MPRTHPLKLLLMLCQLSTVLALGSPSTQAATCPTPNLAPAYSDCNGDWVADAPADKTQWLDPETIILADVPTTDMTERALKAEPFRRYMEKVLERKISYFVSKDAADLIAALRADRVHLLILNTGSVEQAVRCDGFVPVAQAIDATGKLAGYQMEIIVPANSPLRAVSDLKGHTLTFVDERSNSGYKAPRTLLARKFGLEAGRDYRYDFSGRQDNSILGIANGLYEAATVASDLHENLRRDGLFDAKAIRVIYTSETFPHSPWGVNHRLNPALVARIQSAFLNYTGPVGALYGSSRFKAANYKDDWAFMRELSSASGLASTCR